MFASALANAAPLQLAVAALAAGATVQPIWSAEFDADDCDDREVCGPFGPDGPWQALHMFVGSEGEVVHVWPSAGYFSQIPTISTGGEYDPNKSSSANNTEDGRIIDYDDKQEEWQSDTYTNATIEGPAYLDLLEVSARQFQVTKVRANILAAEEWKIGLSNGDTYNASIGNLGFGPPDVTALLRADDDNDYKPPPGILEQLKESEDISHASFGLHMGSVPLGQPGSMILGGYEQNRALGNVGVFALENSPPKVFLRDITLGVETGGSPLNKTGSVWQGLGGHREGARVTGINGGVKDSALVLPNPTSPYIYLPEGNCEAIAEQLPVTYLERLNLWTWNTDDPDFERIVNSPAYLAFILSDSEAVNITIKVPFKLLNLTLEEPLVDKPTQYFPCQSFDPPYGFWQLGRAFLQAAFLGMNYEREVMYLAQAPGPDMDQSIIRELGKDDEKIRTNDADTFEKTWRSTWKPLKKESGSSEDEMPTPADVIGGDGEGNGSSGGGLSSGAIAGIAIGAIGGAIALGVVTAFWLRRRRQARREKAERTEALRLADLKSEKPAPGTELTHEMYSPNKTHEIPGKELRHEMETPVVRYEMDATSWTRNSDEKTR